MSGPVKPVGKFANAPLAQFMGMAAGGAKASGSGWSSAKSWATHAGMVDKKGNITALGQRYHEYGNQNAMSLHLIALHLQHGDAKEEVLVEARRRGLRLSDDELGMLTGYALTLHQNVVYSGELAQTQDLDRAVMLLALLTGLSQVEVRRGITILVRHGYCETWTQAPPHQLTRISKYLRPEDWLATGATLGTADDAAGQRSREAFAEEERVGAERDAAWLATITPPAPPPEVREQVAKKAVGAVLKRLPKGRRKSVTTKPAARAGIRLQLVVRARYRVNGGRESTRPLPRPPGGGPSRPSTPTHESQAAARLRWAPVRRSDMRAQVKTGGDDALGEQAREGIEQARRNEGRRVVKTSERERVSIAQGVQAAKARLRDLAETVADWAQAQYRQFMPGKVLRLDPIFVEVVETGGTYTLRVRGGPEAQKWARILEDGVRTAVDLTQVARLSKKRKAIQIYRAGRGGGGKLVLRGGREKTPGYYLTVPFVYGRGRRTADGKIDLTEVIERKKRDAAGNLRRVSLAPRDMRAMRQRVMRPGDAQESRENELASDPEGAYDGKRFWERQAGFSENAGRFSLDRQRDPVTTGMGPGRVVTRDPSNNRFIVSERPRYAAENPVQRRTQTGKNTFEKVKRRWADVGGGIYREVEEPLAEDDDSGGEFETVESARLTRKLGGPVMFRQHQESGGGEFVRFRRISTRGAAPLAPIPPNPDLAKHIMRDAHAELVRQIGAAIEELRRTASTKRGLSVAQQAELRVLELAR